MKNKKGNEIIVQIVIESTNEEDTTLGVENVAESEIGNQVASSVLRQMAIVLAGLGGNAIKDIEIDETTEGGE